MTPQDYYGTHKCTQIGRCVVMPTSNLEFDGMRVLAVLSSGSGHLSAIMHASTLNAGCQ